MIKRLIARLRGAFKQTECRHDWREDFDKSTPTHRFEVCVYCWEERMVPR